MGKELAWIGREQATISREQAVMGKGKQVRMGREQAQEAGSR